MDSIRRWFASSRATPPNAVRGAEICYDQIVSVDIKPGQACAFGATFAALKPEVERAEKDTLA